MLSGSQDGVKKSEKRTRLNTAECVKKQSISRGTVYPASFECCLRDLNDLSECVECEMMAISGTANFAKNTVATAQCCMQIDTFAEIIYTVSGNC